MPLAALLPLFGYSLSLRRTLGISAAYSLMLAVSAWLAVALVGGLAGLLWPVSALLWLFGTALLVAELVLRARRRDWSPIPVAWGMFVAACVAFWAVHHGSQYFYFDEYGHWGVFLQDMWARDAFWGADTNALHPRYPPAAPLWQYSFGVFAPELDSSAYFAQFVLLTAPLMVLFERLRWRQAGWIAAIIAIVVIGLANFGHSVASLYVDHLVSTWMAGIILVFMTLEREAAYLRALLALPLLVLALLKDAGIAFALATAAILAAVHVVQRFRRGRGAARAVAGGLALGVILLLPAGIALQAWSLNRDAAEVAVETQSFGGVVRGVLRGERALSDDDSALISQRFRHVFLKQQLSKDEISAQYNAFSVPIAPLFKDSFRLTTSSFYLLFAAFFIVLIGVGRLGRVAVPWALVGLGMLGTALCYSAVLYVSYLFAFGERGLILSSYIRYTHSIVLAMYLVAFAALLPATGLIGASWRAARRNVPVAGTAVAGLLAALLVFETPYLRGFTTQNPSLPQRLQAEAVMDEIASAVGDRHLWVYFPADMPNGFLGHLMQFQLAPTPTTVERSAAFFERSDTELLAALQDYDVLWIPGRVAAAEQRLQEVLGVPVGGRVLERYDNGGEITYRPIQF